MAIADKSFRFGLAGVSAALALGLFTTSAQAGFFEQLFGGGQPAQAQPSYGSDASVLPQSNEPFVQLHRRHVTRKVVDTKPALQKPTDIDHDKTLRAGDAVMTKSGIEIYTGHDSGSHRKPEFTSLDNARRIKPSERVALASLDTTRNDPVTKAASPEYLASGRSAAVSSPLVQGVKFTDQHGKTIRYIGP